MLKVGLTGGLASGKSFIGRALESMGAKVIRADELGHRAIEPGGPAYEAVISEFGSGILNEDSTIDRRKLAGLVFPHPERLAKLNDLIHPHVFRMEEELTGRYGAEDPRAIVVVEAAIMIETGSHGRYEKLIVAVCPRELQIGRAMRRDGITREEAEARLARQLPLEEKVRMADFVIDTSESKEETLERTREVYERLRAMEMAKKDV
jgi:dephospho-CoA kinase